MGFPEHLGESIQRKRVKPSKSSRGKGQKATLGQKKMPEANEDDASSQQQALLRSVCYGNDGRFDIVQSQVTRMQNDTKIIEYIW